MVRDSGKLSFRVSAAKAVDSTGIDNHNCKNYSYNMVLRFTVLILLGTAITISSAGTVGQRSKRQEIVMEYHPQCYDDDDCELGFLCYVMDQYDDYGYCEAALVSGSENYPCTDDENCNIGLTCVYSSKFEEHGHCLDVFDSI